MAWKDCRVADIAAPIKNALVGGPFGSNLVSSDYTPTGVPVIRGQNMGLGRWVEGDFAFVSETKALSLSANLAHPGDLVFTQRGTLGQVALVPYGQFDCYLVSQSQMKLTADPLKADPLFLYYLFSSREQQDYITRNAIQTGVPHTNLAILRTTPLELPPLGEQREIAEILGALDDKIELNRRMNETLEAIAKTLFWKRFSDISTEGAITEIADVLSGGTPATDRSEYWNGEYPWASAKDVSQCREPFLIRTERSITRAGLDESATTLVAPLTTVVVARGATTGRMVMFGSAIAMNQTCYGLRAIAEEHYFLYCFLREHMSAIVHAAHGSVFDTITTATLKASRLPLPDPAARMRFHSDVTHFFDMILVNQRESDTLVELRDVLLPKLLSGAIRVGAAEKELAGHV